MLSAAVIPMNSVIKREPIGEARSEKENQPQNEAEGVEYRFSVTALSPRPAHSHLLQEWLIEPSSQVRSSAVSVWAPVTEYVVIPPASLSATITMMPGRRIIDRSEASLINSYSIVGARPEGHSGASFPATWPDSFSPSSFSHMLMPPPPLFRKEALVCQEVFGVCGNGQC